jgi:hypothetical protein
MFENLTPSLKRGGIISTILAVPLFLLYEGFKGIIDAEATRLFDWLGGNVLLPLLGQITDANLWPLTSTLALLVVGFGLALFFWLRTRSNLTRKNQVVDLDDKLFRLVPNLVLAPYAPAERPEDANLTPVQKLDKEMHNLVHRALENSLRVFDGYVTRACLFRPTPDGKCLRIWESYGLPPETIERTEFYIEANKPNLKSGIAGQAFLDGKIHVLHTMRKDGGWTTDREDSFVCWVDRFNSNASYRTFVCVPVTAGTERLGVVCFDSNTSSRIFDSAEVNGSELQKRLAALASRFAVPLQIYQGLQHLLSSQQQNVGQMAH